ncbi:N-acetylmuramoyl-L-alanine amidase [Shouchella miscanthi]|uniref:N-acetylmuramoyl-L-alanine amidase n=1 Tax=Shouchella miscanthi TaxID=2598861 RepID=A0ABU6NMB9_9BACI|nr:N-acetylmuramoyl-L-alanine amidase [Shouchella miscanthi]
MNTNRRQLNGFMIIFTLASILLAVTPAYAVEQGEVTVNTTLNVRSGPSTSAEVIGVKYNGDIVEFINEGQGWGRLIDGSGYVSLDWIKKIDVQAASTNSEVEPKRIMLDPGHGGHDSGAAANGLMEKDIVLAIAHKTKQRLEELGYVVNMTRETDVFLSLEERVSSTSSWGADQFVSIHANGHTNTEARGIETFYHPSSSSSQVLAQSTQQALLQTTGEIDRGVKPETFHVLRNSKIPAILVEVGFITNSEEAVKLNDDAYQTTIAHAIAKGIVEQ